jgi:hypothetical protein
MANLFDAANAPTTEPAGFVVGDFVQWKRTDLSDDYPNAAYTATYISRDATGRSHEFQVTGTASGDDYLFTILGTASSHFDAGHHHWHLEIVRNSDSERIVIDQGHWDLNEDIDVNGTDPRTFAEIMVNKIETILKGKADSDVGSYSIAGRSLTKMTFAELEEARDKYMGIYNREKSNEAVKRGKPSPNTIKVRFN